MKVVSNLELVNNKVSTLKRKKDIACKNNKRTFHASRTSVSSKNKSISSDNDIFSLLHKVESYLQKDLEKYHNIAKDFDRLDKEASKVNKGKKA